MRRVLLTASVLVPLLAPAAGSADKKPLKEVPGKLREELVEYLKSHWQSPEDYVVGKFSQYDIVFIGEYHRIRHDVQLIHNLIPRLYKAGVRNLGIEFGVNEHQDKVDALITAETYDPDLARWLMFKNFVVWGYVEYMDIYRQAWQLNRSLARGAPKFRVVNLGYQPDWTVLKEPRTPEMMQKVWHKGDPDEFMAHVILREFVEKGQKALIYSGSHHAFTRYYQPIYDFQNKRLLRLAKNRMGNVVYHKIPDKVFNIFLHSPWLSKASMAEFNYPVAGAVDRVMRGFPDKRVGFDVKDSPFGWLPDPDTYYSLGYDNFTLKDFCDGYIYQKPLSEYEGVSTDPEFITQKNLQEAIDNLPNPAARERVTTPEAFFAAMKQDADMKRRMQAFE